MLMLSELVIIGECTVKKKRRICGRITGKDNPTGHSERKKKKRQTEEAVGRQYQRVDRNRLCQLN